MMVKVLSFMHQRLAALKDKWLLIKALHTGDVVRLHVIAAGDGQEQQRVKLLVRDAVLASFPGTLKKARNHGAALKVIDASLPGIEQAARAAAQREGYFGSVRAVTGVFPFPDKAYGGVLVPAGAYPALRVILGEGSGKNWWCILYPSLCLSTVTSDPLDITNITFQWHLPAIFKLWF